MDEKTRRLLSQWYKPTKQGAIARRLLARGYPKPKK